MCFKASVWVRPASTPATMPRKRAQRWRPLRHTVKLSLTSHPPRARPAATVWMCQHRPQLCHRAASQQAVVVRCSTADFRDTSRINRIWRPSMLCLASHPLLLLVWVSSMAVCRGARSVSFQAPYPSTYQQVPAGLSGRLIATLRVRQNQAGAAKKNCACSCKCELDELVDVLKRQMDFHAFIENICCMRDLHVSLRGQVAVLQPEGLCSADCFRLSNCLLSRT
ncbi:hypothetical protein BCR37DRAFT_257073 [Protomyces lactucae-debilis]|uniref:Uncharacterized protein n=1 Tax=Protomyces lactucae-debilis TaxID=2754530 RepID=A0A1Y2FQP8_PROLT|nr:uncharacterized protein BCR37DRAFT_257073 [Protomyces lactucae-debilis]ORY85025.1 hypothetical protein BCR37DRAFT_257073 [Protomyces lactucae-debilis]